MTEPATPSEAVAELISLLDLERIEVNLFRGVSPDDGMKRVFGGQVIAQALVAAYRTVENRTCHSLHAYFIRPGDPTVPILTSRRRRR
jgi:acyl-CoA thioesterase-2